MSLPEGGRQWVMTVCRMPGEMMDHVPTLHALTGLTSWQPGTLWQPRSMRRPPECEGMTVSGGLAGIGMGCSKHLEPQLTRVCDWPQGHRVGCPPMALCLLCALACPSQMRPHTTHSRVPLTRGTCTSSRGRSRVGSRHQGSLGGHMYRIGSST